MFHSASVTSSFILTSAALLAGTSQVIATPLPHNTATPQGTACQVSVFVKSLNRDVGYCNGLFDARGNCGFGGYLNDPAKNVEVPKAWAESELARMAVPKSLWEANVNSDPSIINNLCGKTITFTNEKGQTASGIIADHMLDEFFDTCEDGTWKDLGYKDGTTPVNHDAFYVIES